MASSKKPKVASSRQPAPMCRNVIPVSAPKRRDPRFEDACGNFNEDLFKKSYSWINELRSREKSQLKSQIEKTRDLEIKRELRQHLNTLESRDKEIKMREEQKTFLRSIRNQEKELVAQGKRPFFLKKSEEKKLLLINKYKKAVSRSANIDEILERRRRHTASRQHKSLPQRRIRTDSVE